MTGLVYHMTPLRIATARGPVAGYAFTVRRDSPDYAGRLALDVAARIIATSRGDRGTGRDYLANTVRHLEELGIADGALHRIERAGASARVKPVELGYAAAMHAFLTVILVLAMVGVLIALGVGVVDHDQGRQPAPLEQDDADARHHAGGGAGGAWRS